MRHFKREEAPFSSTCCNGGNIIFSIEGRSSVLRGRRSSVVAAEQGILPSSTPGPLSFFWGFHLRGTWALADDPRSPRPMMAPGEKACVQVHSTAAATSPEDNFIGGRIPCSSTFC